MPNKGTAVLILPSQHYLEYGSCVMDKIAQQFKDKLKIIELRGSDANPSGIDSAIQNNDPMFVFGVGHGNVNIYTVECMTPYMQVCDNRTRMMANRVIHLNSCLTAQQLGPDLVNKGALTYYGNYMEFYLLVRGPPCASKFETTVFDAEYTVEKSLFSGKTTGQAQNDRLKAYDDEIKYWTNGPGASDPEAPIAVQVLTIDKNIAKMLGKDNVTITSGGGVSPALLYAMAALTTFATFGYVSYIGTKHKKV